MHAPTHAHTVHSYNTETYTVSIDLQTYTTQRDAYHKETMRLSSMHSSRRLVKTEGGSLKYNMGCHFWRGFWIVVVRTKLSYAELANLSAHNSQHTSRLVILLSLVEGSSHWVWRHRDRQPLKVSLGPKQCPMATCVTCEVRPSQPVWTWNCQFACYRLRVTGKIPNPVTLSW